MPEYTPGVNVGRMPPSPEEARASEDHVGVTANFVEALRAIERIERVIQWCSKERYNTEYWSEEGYGGEPNQWEQIHAAVNKAKDATKAAQREAMEGCSRGILEEAAIYWKESKLSPDERDLEIVGMRRAEKKIRALIEQLGKE